MQTSSLDAFISKVKKEGIKEVYHTYLQHKKDVKDGKLQKVAVQEQMLAEYKEKGKSKPERITYLNTIIIQADEIVTEANWKSWESKKSKARLEAIKKKLPQGVSLYPKSTI